MIVEQEKIKLEKWWNTFKDYERLNINKVKLLFQKYELTLDTQMFNEIVYGTMYLIYEQLKDSYYLYYHISDFDIDDIIMIGIEKWLIFLKNGGIKDIKIFSDYFKKGFHYQIINQVLDNKISTVKLYKMGYRKMANNFSMYVNGITDLDISKELYQVFDQLIVVADKLGIDLKLVSYRQFEFLIKPLIYIMLKERLNPRMVSSDECENVIDKMVLEDFNKIVKVPTRNAMILQAYYGYFDDEKITREKLGEYYGCTKQNIARILKSEIKRIRKQLM